MSRNRSSHPVPRGGIDPIRSRQDALDGDALFQVIDTCVDATRGHPGIDGAMILASSRPHGDAEPDNVHRWLEASDQCRSAGSNWSSGSCSADPDHSVHVNRSANPSGGRPDGCWKFEVLA